jgi:hypothetical protein
MNRSRTYTAGLARTNTAARRHSRWSSVQDSPIGWRWQAAR